MSTKQDPCQYQHPKVTLLDIEMLNIENVSDW